MPNARKFEPLRPVFFTYYLRKLRNFSFALLILVTLEGALLVSPYYGADFTHLELLLVCGDINNYTCSSIIAAYYISQGIDGGPEIRVGPSFSSVRICRSSCQQGPLHCLLAP